MRMLLAVATARASRMAPTGGAGGQSVRERLAVGGWVSMSHLSIVKIGGEAGDFKPPLTRFLPLPCDCTYSLDACTIYVPT